MNPKEETINLVGPIAAGSYPLSIAYGRVPSLAEPDLRLDVSIRNVEDTADVLRITERSETANLYVHLGTPPEPDPKNQASTPESHAQRIEDLRQAGHLSSMARVDLLDEEEPPTSLRTPEAAKASETPTRYVVRWHVRPQVPVTVTVLFPNASIELRSKPQR